MAQARESAFSDELRTELDARFRGPLMSFFLRRVRDRTEAEDLTQEVFVRVVGAKRIGDVRQPDAFVFRIAANLLADRGRRHQRRNACGKVPFDEAMVDELARELVEDRSPERVLLGQETLSSALQTLDELGERTRDIFILFRLENMKQREIAQFFGISQSTVEKHVMKAVLHLAVRHGDKP
jgi:RNA polymerase sigma-70 factor (ECF subfamily)